MLGVGFVRPRMVVGGGQLFLIGTRERRLPPPPLVVWRSLFDPHQSGARPWLDLLDDERPPTIVLVEEPTLIVWSSLWPSRPRDLVRFDLRASGVETALRWTLTSPDEPPDASRTGHLRRRMNVLINERLRRSYGQ
jgi:hypothetical protein